MNAATLPDRKALALALAGGLCLALAALAWASQGEAIYLALLNGGYIACF